MKLDIPYYIRQVLREQRKAYVPGIGTFRLDQTPANFNEDKSVISPPSLNLTFDDAESDDNALLKYIMDTGLFTEDKAKKKLNQFTQSAFNKLLNVDSVMINGLGKLIKKEESSKVEFEPNISELTMEYKDLTPLSLTPISRFVEQTPAAAESIPVVEDSGSYLLRILLLSLLLIALWFLGRYLFNSYYNQSEKPKTEILGDEDKKNVTAEIDQSSDQDLEQKYEEIDELIDSSDDSAQIKGNLPDNNDQEVVKSIEDVKEKKEDADVGGNNDEDQNVFESNAGFPSAELGGKADPVINKHADIIPESGKCIIVVGSFIKSLNAIKMTSLLERKGYKVFRSEYKGFTRVGLIYECADEDLEAFLQNIRKKISKKAWYLDPDLEVPYLN